MTQESFNAAALDPPARSQSHRTCEAWLEKTPRLELRRSLISDSSDRAARIRPSLLMAERNRFIVKSQ